MMTLIRRRVTLLHLIYCFSKGWILPESKSNGGTIMLVPCDSFRRYKVLKRVLLTLVEVVRDCDCGATCCLSPNSTDMPSFTHAGVARPQRILLQGTCDGTVITPLSFFLSPAFSSASALEEGVLSSVS